MKSDTRYSYTNCNDVLENASRGEKTLFSNSFGDSNSFVHSTLLFLIPVHFSSFLPRGSNEYSMIFISSYLIIRFVSGGNENVVENLRMLNEIKKCDVFLDQVHVSARVDFDLVAC